MPKDKEGSAVAALLDEINELRKRVEVLEMYTGAYMTRGVYRTSDAVGYRGSYENIGPRPSLDGTPEDDTIYATTSDNITIPLTGISGHYGGTASCRSSHS